MKNSDVIIDMQGITKAFQGVVALDDVSLTAYKGEIRALIGENGAGKSTLMNILNGSLKQDYGTITYKGKQISYKSTAEAIQNGISMVHQEITLVPEMNVAENIWMGREKMFRGTLGINWDSCYKKTQELLDKLSIKINPHSMISNLTVAQTQLVEIARAVSYNSDIIIMDEPTSSLSDNETELLFSIMKNLAQNGCTIIFISHKIDEIFRICDTVTVMRDGKTIATEDCSDITPDILIQQIVGRKVSNLYPKESHFTDEVVLSVKGLSSPGIFSDVSFELKKGEILGFSGLIGAGRTEIMNAIFGLDKYAAGEVYVHGKRIDNKKTITVVKGYPLSHNRSGTISPVIKNLRKMSHSLRTDQCGKSIQIIFVNDSLIKSHSDLVQIFFLYHLHRRCLLVLVEEICCPHKCNSGHHFTVGMFSKIAVAIFLAQPDRFIL